MVVKARGLTLSAAALVILAGCAADAGDDANTDVQFLGASGELTIAFSPMYSAYDGTHPFKIPAIVKQNVQGVQWSVEPPTAADLTRDATTGSVMIQTRMAGDFKIVATAGKLKGSADLHVTAATPEQWALGEARYQNDVKIMLPMPGQGMPMMGPPSLNFPDNAACNNCHGAGAQSLHIEHTPQQIGGYSDQELVTIFTTGTKPMGSSFKSIIPPFFYKMFHTWGTASPEETQALVVYLRSLEPRSQPEIDYAPPPRP